MLLSFFKRLVRIEIALVLLVILAGSVVRMTGSGMGCPDWPKCFGLLIPPTERAQLEWQSQKSFKQGQMIILNDELLVARRDFTAGAVYNPAQWEPYTRHNYAKFVPLQTWIEYINRLLGALSGLPMLVLLALSVLAFRQKPLLLAFSLAGVVLLGFVAWLGKLVVDGNLIPGSITIHMMGALLVLTVLVAMDSYLHRDTYQRRRMPAWAANVLLLALVLSVIQVIFGTQVREQIDLLDKAGLPRIKWIAHLEWEFKFHRSFSLLVLGVNGLLWYQNSLKEIGYWQFKAVMLLILVEIITGIFMAYFYVPKLAQPVHLLLAAMMFGVQMHAWWTYHWSSRPMRSTVVPQSSS